MSLHDVLLILHFLGLALGVGTSFAMLTLGIAAKSMAPEARMEFFRRAILLGKNGSIGLALLLISGLGLLFEHGTDGAAQIMKLAGGAFHAKLTMVAILTGLVGYMQVLTKRLRLGQDAAATAARMPKIGRIVLLLGVGIVITAVLAFH